MIKLKLLGAAALLFTALATPSMAQEATQEPGMIGFNYPNSAYLRGGYGVRLPNQWERQSFGYYAPRAYSPGYNAGPVVVDGVAAGVIATAPASPYDSYGYYNGDTADW